MDRRVKKFIKDFLEISHDDRLHFREICGFTFIFEEDIVMIHDRIPSVTIYPIGIIYEENDEYFFAPLAGINDLDEIVKEYVKDCLK